MTSNPDWPGDEFEDEFSRMVERSSLGTPTSKAHRHLGKLILEGYSEDEALAAMTPEERRLVGEKGWNQ